MKADHCNEYNYGGAGNSNQIKKNKHNALYPIFLYYLYNISAVLNLFGSRDWFHGRQPLTSYCTDQFLTGHGLAGPWPGDWGPLLDMIKILRVWVR